MQTQEATHRDVERSLVRLMAEHEDVRQELFDNEEYEAEALLDKHKDERRQLVTGLLGPVNEGVLLDLQDKAFYSLTPDQLADQPIHDAPFFNIAEAPRKKRQAIRLRKVTK